MRQDNVKLANIISDHSATDALDDAMAKLLSYK